MTVQERILSLMEKKGWTKYRLAQETGLYQTTVYDWFNDKGYTPDRKSIELICAAMNISLVEFYSGIDAGELNGDEHCCYSCLSKFPKVKDGLYLICYVHWQMRKSKYFTLSVYYNTTNR